MKFPLFKRAALAGAISLYASIASAGITLDGTRIIFSAPSKETSIVVNNQGADDIMVQSWVESNVRSQPTDVPFAITPPLVRLGSHKRQVLRILYQGQGLPTDKESVFWLAVQEIPQKAKVENALQIAIRQRIKLFYRPENLTGSAIEAPKSLQWQLVEQGGATVLRVTNPSAFHVSFSGSSVTIRNSLSRKGYPVPAEMLAPGETRTTIIPGVSHFKSGSMTVEYDSINDYGGLDRVNSAVSN